MAQDESEDVSSPADATVVDESSDAAQPADEAAPADEAPPADQDAAPAEPAAIPTPPIQPVPTPPLQQAQPTAVTTPGSQTVEVTLNDAFTLTLSSATVSAGRVTLIAKNVGRMTHGVGVEGLGVEQFVPAGGSLTREIMVRAGTYVIYCPVA